MAESGTKKYYIIAPSYAGFVFAIQSFPLQDCVFVTGNQSLINLIEKIGGNLIMVEPTKGARLRDLFKYKKHIAGLAKTIVGKEVYFTFNYSAVFLLFMAYKLKRSNKVFFLPLDPQHGVAEKEDGVKYADARKTKWIYRFLLGLKTEVFQAGKNYFMQGVPVQKLQADFLAPSGISYTHFEANKDVILEKMGGIAAVDFIYIDNGIAKYEGAKQVLLKWLKQLKGEGHSIAIKPHPRIELGAGFEDYAIMPSELPAELTFSVVKEGVIGFYSAVLNFLADKHQVVSLIAFVEDSEWKNYIQHQFLNEGIHKPSQEDELSCIFNTQANE